MIPKRLNIIGWFLFVIFLLAMAGCNVPPDTPAAPTLTQAVAPALDAATPIPPEPTNTAAPPAPTAAAGDPCSVAGQQQMIDAAFASYQATRTTADDALLGLNRWASRVTADIANGCNRDNFELSDPAELRDLLDKLYEGGYVIYVRHTHTDRSRGDDDVSFGMCDQQRILSDRGRDEARMIRQAYDQLDLPIGELTSTQYCRTLETAVLAFDVPLVTSRTDLSETLTDRLATEPDPGTNTMIVAHIGTIRNAIGLDDTFEEGDSLVYRPTGNGNFEYVGRIGLYDWPVMAQLSQN